MRPKNPKKASKNELISYISFLEENLTHIRGLVGVISMSTKEEQTYQMSNETLDYIFKIQNAGWKPKYEDEDEK